MSNLFTEYAGGAVPRIEAALDAFLPAESGPAARLRAAMRYAVTAGGKRLRPVLCLAACRAFGDDDERAMPAACALEVVHAFTLVHDDLPCMDDDDMRRGRPTCHKVYGEAMAVLAGDALHNLAYSILARHCYLGLPAGSGAAVMDEFTRAVFEVCEGQALDIESEGAPRDDAALKFIHDNKTGALLRASVVCGALCGGAGSGDVAKLAEFAAEAGALFQNVDDILDAEGAADVTGKSGPSDVKRDKLTSVSALGVEGAVKLAAGQRDRAVAALAGIGGAKVLAAFPEYVFERIPARFR